MNDRFVPLSVLIPGVFLVAGLVTNITVGLGTIQFEWGFLGVALCVIGAVCHVHCRLDQFESRTIRAQAEIELQKLGRSLPR